ncbi:MAG: transglycosylase domain-containing protein, partial [Pseudonocardiaceae bacterium]
YKVTGTTVELTPGDAGTIDGKKQFIGLRVQYDKTLQTITALNETQGNLTSTLEQLNRGAALNKAALEPELMSAASGEDRGKRRVIGFQDAPPQLVKAITVTEDRMFFEHRGINIRGIARAFFSRYAKDEDEPLARQGGSSITQQLVKNLLLSPEKTLKRKFAEAYMSVILETRLSKEEIFALYCNQIYMGQQSGFAINGIGQAAQNYFGKDVTQITLPEAAFLAGTIRSPNRYNPFRHPDVALARRNQVLDSMAETGAITAAEAAGAKQTPLTLAPKKAGYDEGGVQYFSDYVEAELEKKLTDPAALQRLRVYTTVDMDLQRAADAAVTNRLARLDKSFRKVPPGTLQAALVALNAQT